MMALKTLLHAASAQHASDVHFSADSKPWLRIDGILHVWEEAPPITASQLEGWVRTLQVERKIADIAAELDICVTLPNNQRCRLHGFREQAGWGLAARLLPQTIPSLIDLHLPESVIDCLLQTRGLILVTGPTGSGKSTTLAAMVNFLNETTHQHIITLEDPIEFLHPNKQCFIHQRQIPEHSLGWQSALRAALRADPDVLLIGELRDLESIRLALTAAETGHLVLASLHTPDACHALSRIIDVFPGDEKSLVQNLLAESLQAIVAQALIARNGGGRIAMQEVLIATPAIRNLIREYKIPQVYSALQTGQQNGMRTFAQHQQQLLAQNLINAGYVHG